jgi:hypothetical protein
VEIHNRMLRLSGMLPAKAEDKTDRSENGKVFSEPDNNKQLFPFALAKWVLRAIEVRRLTGRGGRVESRGSGSRVIT